jgi:dihydroanticapsin dehydrogenase
MTSGRLDGRVAVVTGAGVGIGRVVCERLAEEGAEVVPTSRTQEHLDETAQAVASISGRPPRAFVLDVADGPAVERVVNEIGTAYGRIDVVCNNAGIDLPHAPALADVTDDEWETIFRVNVTGMFRVCRAALRFMREGGSIVNVGSMNSFVAWPNDGPYTASKGAVLQFSRALALDVAQRQIRVTCVCPGVIDTPLTRSFISAAEDPAAVVAEYDTVAPLGRMGTAREVANCVLFLASDDASFVTGAALLVDGGSTASA